MSTIPLTTVPVDFRQASTDELAQLCKALAHPARIKILQHLLEENRCVCGRIVEVLPLAQSTVSQHLKILKESGLVQGEIEGPSTCYCIDKQKVTLLCKTLSTLFNTEEEK